MTPLGDAIGNLLIFVAGVGMLAMGAWRAIVWCQHRRAPRAAAYLLDAFFTAVVRLDRDFTMSRVAITTPQTAGALGSPPDTGAPASSLVLEPRREGTAPASVCSGGGAAGDHQGSQQGSPVRPFTRGWHPQGDTRTGARRPATAAPRSGSASDDDGRRCHV